jgi:hypothetical protein
MDEYEIWLRAQRQARLYGRLTTAIGVLGGAAVAYVLAPEGYGHVLKLALAVLWGLVSGRAVEHVVLGFAGSVPRPATGWLALGALALGALATALLLYYFELEMQLIESKDPFYSKRDRSDEWTLAALIATVSGAGGFFLITKGPDPEVFHDAAEHGAASAKSGSSGHSMAVVKARLIVGVAAVVLLAGIPFAAAHWFDWRGLVPVAASIVLSLAGWWIVAPQVAGRARRAAAAAEVQEELAAIRAANSRLWLGRLAALGSAIGLMVAGNHGLGVYAERVNRGAPYHDRFEPGLQHGFWLLVASIALGLFVQKAFAPKPEIAATSAAVTGGVFDESIAHTGSIEVRQKLTLTSVLFGSLGRDQYEMIDGGHAFCGHAAERSGFLSRLFLGGRRAIDLVVDDLGRDAMRLRRGFVWLPFFNRAQVLEGTRPVGRIEQRWSIVRRYTLTGADGGERYELRSGLIFRSRFQVRSGGVQVGELRRVRKPWYVRMFTPFWTHQDRFSLVFPQGAGLDDRRLLVGAVFLVDISHYPTQSTVRWGAIALIALALIPGADEPDRSRDERRTPAYDVYDD